VDVLERLKSCLQITPNTEKWAEGRRDAAIAIATVLRTVGVKQEPQGECDL